MKRFVFLHYGFEKPTPEIMAAWGKWFESTKDNIVDMGGHFSGGREISKAGTKDLPLGLESITGFTIVSADSRSLLTMLIVGSILNVINQGDAFVRSGTIDWWKLLLTYCVPFCVATFGAYSAYRAVGQKTTVR